MDLLDLLLLVVLLLDVIEMEHRLDDEYVVID
jgi:hypothetical protein